VKRTFRTALLAVVLSNQTWGCQTGRYRKWSHFGTSECQEVLRVYMHRQ